MKYIKYLIYLLVLLLPSVAVAQSFYNPHAVVGGGYTPYRANGVVGTVLTVKGTHATLGGYHVGNPAATVCYLQLFNVLSATTVTLGTTVPTQSIEFSAGGGANIPPAVPGIDFSLGLKIAATTTATGSTPCGTGMDVNFWYK